MAANVTGNATVPKCSQVPNSDVFAIVQGVFLFFLFVSLGAAISFEEVKKNLRTPKGLIISQLGQFFLMPFLGWAFAKIFALPAAAAVGLVVMTTAPGGAMSNIAAVLYQADIALSVCATAASSIIAMGMMPLNQYIYLIATKLVPGTCINYTGILISAILVVLGSALGVFAKPFFQNREWYWGIRLIHFGGFVSILGICFAGFILNAGKGSSMAFFNVPGNWIAASVLPWFIGTVFGIVASRLAGLARPSAVVVALEIGIQNQMVASAVLTFLFAPNDPRRGASIAIPIIYSFIAMVASIVWVGIAWKLGWTNMPRDKGFFTAFKLARQKLNEDREREIYGDKYVEKTTSQDGKVADSVSTLGNNTQDLEAGTPEQKN